MKSTTKVRKKVSKKHGYKTINQYTIERKLGQGKFATVYLCKESHTATLYALKRMNKSFLSRKPCGNTKSAYDCVREELKVLQRLEHPNVIWLHEIIDDPDKDHIYLVTDYHSRGSLGDLVETMNAIYEEHNVQCQAEGRPQDVKRIGLSVSKARLYLRDMLKALHYCHREIGVIHRDIKPDNIVINHNNEAVLIDFGMSALIAETDKELLEKNLGSYMFFAPEMFEKYEGGAAKIGERGEMTDVWALGVTLYYLLTGRYPCGDAQSPYHLKQLIQERPIDFEIIKQPEPRAVVQMLLNKDPAKRATIEQVAAAAWATNHGKESLDFQIEVDDEKEGFGNMSRIMRRHKSSRSQLFETNASSERSGGRA